MSKQIIVCLIGPSCVGKTTIAKKMLELRICKHYLRSVTDRLKRPNEDDFEYTFLDKFNAEDCVEHTEYSGHHYGILRSEVEKALEHGIAVSVVTYDGYESLAAYCKDKAIVIPIGIDATDLDIRIRLGGRTPEEREARLKRVDDDRIASAGCVLHFVNATTNSVYRISVSIGNLINIITKGYKNGDDENDIT